MSDARAMIGLLVRFGITGLINSAVGFGTILALDLGLHLAPPIANAAGFLIGIPLNYVLSRSFVFRDAGAARTSAPKYLMVVALAFTLNQLVLRVAGAALGAGALQHTAAQLAGMAAYTGLTFLACRFWVFRPAQEAASP